MMKRILLGSLGFYRTWVSPGFQMFSPIGCKFHPTCSQYAAEAIEMHGAAKGGWMALRRLTRCHPFSRGGFDPVAMAENPFEATPIGFPQRLNPMDRSASVGPAAVVPCCKALSGELLPRHPNRQLPPLP